MTTRRGVLSTLAGGAAAGATGFAQTVADGRAAGTSKVPKLKISAVKAVRLKGINSRFVRVHTDQGLTGTGETLDTLGAEDIINKDLASTLIGRDPLDIEAIWNDMFSWSQSGPAVFRRGLGGPYLAAMSGIEIALWDLAGKAMGVPLYRLFGGRVRSKVAVYFHALDAEGGADIVRKTGVKALKHIRLDAGTDQDNPKLSYDPGRHYGWTLANAEIDAFASRLAALRKAVGPDIGIGLECHTRYDAESALQLAKAVEPYRPMWLEEPVPSDNPEVMAMVRRASRVPIACGENVYTRYGFLPFLEKQAVSVIQLDMAKCGGLLESRKIAAMAEVYHIPIAPHGMTSPLGTTAFAHVCATVPNFMLLEWGHYFHADYNNLMKSQPVYNAGFLEVPETPGIGVELDDRAIKDLALPGYEL
jgi:galactonate dehydratase